MPTPRQITNRSKAWQVILQQVVAAATNLAASTNYFLLRSPVPLRIFNASANVRTAISGASTSAVTFEFRTGVAVNDNAPGTSIIGSAIAIQPGKYGSPDFDMGREGFVLPANVGLWVRCTGIGTSGTPAGLDVALTVGYA